MLTSWLLEFLLASLLSTMYSRDNIGQIISGNKFNEWIFKYIWTLHYRVDNKTGKRFFLIVVLAKFDTCSAAFRNWSLRGVVQGTFFKILKLFCYTFFSSFKWTFTVQLTFSVSSLNFFQTFLRFSSVSWPISNRSSSTGFFCQSTFFFSKPSRDYS